MPNHSPAVCFLDWVRRFRNRTGHNPSDMDVYRAGFVAGVKRERAAKRTAK